MKESKNLKIKKPQCTYVSDITYSQVNYWFNHVVRDLKMNIIYPESCSQIKNKKYPCFVWFCGGGWQTLDKSAHSVYLSKIASSGYVVCSCEYRTTNEAQYPSQVIDCKSAIRYIKKNASRYNIDPDRIIVAGESAGGYLASMLCVNDDKKLDEGENLEYSSSVNGAVIFYAPVDFKKTVKADRVSEATSCMSLLLGVNVYDDFDISLKASVLNYIDKKQVPFLILHGTDDEVVSHKQSEMLYDALKKYDTDCTLLSLEKAGHADVYFYQDEVWKYIIKFLDERFK